MSGLSAFPRENKTFYELACANLDGSSCMNPWIAFTEDAIRRHLGIRGDLPDANVDDDYVALTKAYKNGEDLNMTEIFQVIDQEGANWANNPANTIPSSLDHAILNAKASTWHKIIMANINPKTHATNFDMDHALLIYVLMTQGLVNLPRMMRDILLVRPMKHPRKLLPYAVFISRLAIRHEVPEYVGDEFYIVREVDMYVPYGDWRGEQARVHRGQGHQIANTQLIIRQAFPETDFTGLEEISSDERNDSASF
ncbi:hypothetical protein PIB30_000516 [Stylosanthes scabra]|uniref:Putative plant transposon protein domain-containing protein n=1 Tax=Stylosanthes scabra TaxID=79078 RepID=A0ABU6W0W9_9FABA|nr:hypothetical protein [Stylosanthes scabra]